MHNFSKSKKKKKKGDPFSFVRPLLCSIFSPRTDWARRTRYHIPGVYTRWSTSRRQGCILFLPPWTRRISPLSYLRLIGFSPTKSYAAYSQQAYRISADNVAPVIDTRVLNTPRDRCHQSTSIPCRVISHQTADLLSSREPEEPKATSLILHRFLTITTIVVSSRKWKKRWLCWKNYPHSSERKVKTFLRWVVRAYLNGF